MTPEAAFVISATVFTTWLIGYGCIVFHEVDHSFRDYDITRRHLWKWTLWPFGVAWYLVSGVVNTFAGLVLMVTFMIGLTEKPSWLR